MQEKRYDIQGLVKVSGVARRTVYFYVQQGLLPPPEGAGLAAYYTDQHLLRLRLIPILRQKGMRLDEIRKTFGTMSEDEMLSIVEASLPVAALAVPAPRSQTAGVAGTAWPERQTFAPEFDAQGGPWVSSTYTLHQLPDGLCLLVPAGLSQLEKQRMARLLQAAAQIYNAPVEDNNLPNGDQTSSTPE